MENGRKAVRATEQLYDNIYELNITKNCSVGKRTREYFKSLGANDLPYGEVCVSVADKQIKEEFREGMSRPLIRPMLSGNMNGTIICAMISRCRRRR